MKVLFGLSKFLFMLVVLSRVACETFPYAAPYHVPLIYKGDHSQELDVAAMRRESAAVSSDDDAFDLIERTREVLKHGIGMHKEEDLADEFIFQFPVIGPLTKQDYLKAIRSCDVFEALQDANAGYHTFSLCPVHPNRVWFHFLFRGTYTGDTKIFGKATNRTVVLPPQVFSLTFDPQNLKVLRLTEGYPVDKDAGNSGGLGGIFGIAYSLGRPFPFPEARPYKASLRLRFLRALASIFNRLKARKIKRARRSSEGKTPPSSPSSVE